MLRIKKLDIFVLKSFLLLFFRDILYLPFHFHDAVSMEICRWIGRKRFGNQCSCPVFLLSALTLIPLSLPLAILLAALMTFGNFGERYELLSMKAAGIPLFRIIRPVVLFCMFRCHVILLSECHRPQGTERALDTAGIHEAKIAGSGYSGRGVYSDIEGYNIYVKKKTVIQAFWKTF